MIETVIIFGAKDKHGETASLCNKFLMYAPSYRVIFCDDFSEKDHDYILGAKNIIVFTPTYWFGLPSRLQKLIEDLTAYEEKKYNFLEGKRFACVAYSPHGGDIECITKLGLIFNGWGCEIVSCGLQYFRSTTNFDKDHWNLEDLKTLASKF